MQLCGSRGQRRTGACCRGWGSSTGQPTTHNIQVCAGLLKAWGEQVAEWPDLQLLGTYWPGTADRGNRLRHAQVKSESAFKVVSERSSQAPGKQLLMAGKRVNCWHTRGKYVAAYWYAHNAAGTPEERAAVAAYAVEEGKQLQGLYPEALRRAYIPLAGGGLMLCLDEEYAPFQLVSRSLSHRAYSTWTRRTFIGPSSCGRTTCNRPR